MKNYEMKQITIDPFDIMCGDCEEHEIEYWKPATEEELKELHSEMILADEWTPEWEKQRMIDEGSWNPTPENFDEWLQQAIKNEHVRVAEQEV